MNDPPPPPPPHGENPKSSGLPPGKYDIFIIPPHSSGSGFLYLPSLRPNVNSFAAGFATALILVAIGSMLAPAFQVWWNGVKNTGGMGMWLLMFAIALGAWALGRTQTDGATGAADGSAPRPPPHSSGAAPSGSQYGHTQPPPNTHSSPPPPNSGPGVPPSAGQGERPKSSWQRPTNPTGSASTANMPGSTGSTNTASGSASSHTPKTGGWEKAREETRKREEERKAKEAEKKRKEEIERKLKEFREKEAKEREAREKREKERLEKEKELEREKEKQKEWEKAREAEKQRQKEKELETQRSREKEQAERLKREQEAKANLERAKELEMAKLKQEARPKTTYSFSAVGEKTNPWPGGKPPEPRTPSPKKPPPPTAQSYAGTEDDAHSYRPYDKPTRPGRKKSLSSLYSESSYAASHTTARTTPPPSTRGPYSTKDPDKIVIKAVYSFNNTFMKTPISQLVSGVGAVTDGLILRITTEGLFIDDDVRGVPQREWDVKAWTMKLVEVWCPSASIASATAVPRSGSATSHRKFWRFDKDRDKGVAMGEEADALLIDLLRACKENCLYSSNASYASSDYSASTSFSRHKNSPNQQTGEYKPNSLHVLRASIRDQEGKKYVFVLFAEESWKVAVGLQRLRRGTQVRALGLSGMSAADVRSTLENLQWA